MTGSTALPTQLPPVPMAPGRPLLKGTDFLSQFILYGAYFTLHRADAILDVIL
jgi:hypothetical protein